PIMEYSRPGGRHVGTGDAQMEIGTPMQCGIRTAGVIEIGSRTIAGPVSIEVSDLNWVKAGCAEIHIGFDGCIAVAAVVIDDVNTADRDAGTVIGSCAQT